MCRSQRRHSGCPLVLSTLLLEQDLSLNPELLFLAKVEAVGNPMGPSVFAPHKQWGYRFAKDYYPFVMWVLRSELRSE